MYDKATDLDPQPEFPLRTEFTFFVEQEPEVDKYMVVDGVSAEQQAAAVPVQQGPPFMTLLILWFFGLIVWCMLFVNGGGKPSRRTRTLRKKAGGVKDV